MELAAMVEASGTVVADIATAGAWFETNAGRVTATAVVPDPY